MTLALSKYAGSHADLAAEKPGLFPMPDEGGRVFVPFVGAGAPVFELYAGRHPLVLSDKNPRLVNAWVQVRDDVDGVVHWLDRIVGTWRSIVTACDPDERDERGGENFEMVRGCLDEGGPSFRAAKMLFVLRASFNGLWRVNQAGGCNSPYGKPDPDADLVRGEDLRRMSTLLDGASIACEDFEVTMGPARAGDVSYLDPPFQGTHTAYCPDSWEWEARQCTLPGLGESNARERLAALLHELHRRGVRWSLSDADNPVTRRLYAGWNCTAITRQNSVTCKGSQRGDGAAEGLWRNWP